MGTLLVLDFDGTMTDAEQEGAPFREGYLEDLVVLTGMSRDEVFALAEEFESMIAGDPETHGWVFRGQIVAPATVDPYLRIMPVARMIFDRANVFASDEDRNRLLDGILYKYNYRKTTIAFNPEAEAVLSSLAGTNTYVITNSDTEPVQNKIRSLSRGTDKFDWLIERVYGSAKKYVVDPSFEDVDEAMFIDGLNRPVLLRRQLYYQTIKRLLDEQGLDWTDLVVVGDIFELDLAMPLALGARVGLVSNQFTPPYEKEFLAKHPRGRLINSLKEILQLVKD
jgi:FMN phosphatase YigB (HAD superfamily)